MKYSSEDRKKFITKRFIINQKICDCCNNVITGRTMWKVERYNQRGTSDSWYYCLSCFDSKDELLLEIDSDSYPYGLYPIDYDLKKDGKTWGYSLSDMFRKNEIPLHNKNMVKKRVKKR